MVLLLLLRSRLDPGSSHLVTVIQQLFSVAISCLSSTTVGRGSGQQEKRGSTQASAARGGAGFFSMMDDLGLGLSIPLRFHAGAAACLLGACFLGNLALDIGLPLPLFFLAKVCARRKKKQ